MRSLNLAVKFLLELAAFASLAVWGWQVGNTATGVVLAIAAPAVAIAMTALGQWEKLTAWWAETAALRYVDQVNLVRVSTTAPWAVSTRDPRASSRTRLLP
ncbi:DUF2568 domain-containing protein [Nocardioides sp.]|uniref:DUF2568 domain-containing protein n=1 Tax=Nocardioides sp. TaxID=35761 RepID=UPI0039E62774